MILRDVMKEKGIPVDAAWFGLHGRSGSSGFVRRTDRISLLLATHKGVAESVVEEAQTKAEATGRTVGRVGTGTAGYSNHNDHNHDDDDDGDGGSHNNSGMRRGVGSSSIGFEGEMARHVGLSEQTYNTALAQNYTSHNNSGGNSYSKGKNNNSNNKSVRDGASDSVSDSTPGSSYSGVGKVRFVSAMSPHQVASRRLTNNNPSTAGGDVSALLAAVSGVGGLSPTPLTATLSLGSNNNNNHPNVNSYTSNNDADGDISEIAGGNSNASAFDSFVNRLRARDGQQRFNGQE